MARTVKLLDFLGAPETSIRILKNTLNESGVELIWDNQSAAPPAEPPAALKKRILAYDICLLTDQLALEADRFIHHRSVGSHFLKYTDYIENSRGELWGSSLYTEVFLEVFLRAVQNQDFKGPVIFLGAPPLVLPIMEVLARYGFSDFVFLKLEGQVEPKKIFSEKLPGLFNVTISTVDSADFIRSQKEYSFCFVMQDSYSQQTLDDMSYFHFLSAKSMVFDMSGCSNFLFKEVKALGVDIVGFADTAQTLSKHISVRILKFVEKMS